MTSPIPPRLPLRLAALALLAALAAPADAQRAWSADGPPPAHEARPVAGQPAGQPAVAHRSFLTFYTDRAAFNAAFPGLPVEDFEDVDAPPVSFCNSPSPVNATTNNACVGAGDIMEGLEVAAQGPNENQPDAIFAAGVDFLGNPSLIIGPEYVTDRTVLRFDPPVQAVGVDTYSRVPGLNTVVQVYSEGGTFLGATEYASNGPTTPRFLGVSSDEVIIGAVHFVDFSASGGILVDDVAYGDGRGCAIKFLDADLTYDAGTRKLCATVTVRNNGNDPVFTVLLLDFSRIGGPAGVRRLGSSALPGGITLTRTICLNVPTSAPPGDYTFRLRLLDEKTGTECSVYEETIFIGGTLRPGDGGAFEAEAAGDVFAASAVAGAVAVTPNPFADRTRITYEVAEAQAVRLAVYDVLGRAVAVLVDGEVETGAHTAVFDGSRLAAGVYFVRMTAGAEVFTQRLTLAR